MNNEPSDTFTIVHPDGSCGVGVALRRASRVEPLVPPPIARLLDDLPAPRRAPKRIGRREAVDVGRSDPGDG